MAQSTSLEREILGITGLASVWSTSGPSEPVASLTPPLTKKTAAWELTVKWPFTDQPDKEGVRQTSTTLVSCESSNYKLSKTI